MWVVICWFVGHSRAPLPGYNPQRMEGCALCGALWYRWRDDGRWIRYQ